MPARGAPGKNLFAHERRRVIGDWEFSAGRVDRGGTLRIGSIVIDCDDFPRMMALWKEALHYVPKYSPDGGWVILKDLEGRGPNLSLNLPSRRSPGLVSASPGSLCRGPEGRGQASPPPRCDSSSVRATRGGLRRPRGPGRQPVLRRPSVMQLNRPIGSLNRSKGYSPLEHGD